MNACVRELVLLVPQLPGQLLSPDMVTQATGQLMCLQPSHRCRGSVSREGGGIWIN